MGALRLVDDDDDRQPRIFRRHDADERRRPAGWGRRGRWRPSARCRSCRRPCSPPGPLVLPCRPVSVTPRMIRELCAPRRASSRAAPRAAGQHVDRAVRLDHARDDARLAGVAAAAIADTPPASAAASRSGPGRTRRWRSRCRPTWRPAARCPRARRAGRCRSAARSRSSQARRRAARGPACAQSWSRRCCSRYLNTSATVSTPCGWVSWIGYLPTIIRPIRQSKRSSGPDGAGVKRGRNRERLHGRAPLDASVMARLRAPRRSPGGSFGS